ncbi:MAG TPA: RNA polymerase-binding protein RbpA [Mycobacteriales bacterium]|nr:RNA polymerase-binding protein RbpA [Mycobacteriales bacterium]
MAERILRGSRLGAASYETDRNTDLAPRRSVEFACPRGHSFTVPIAEGAEAPTAWECKACGAIARRVDGTEPAAKKVKPSRTHWDMLLERRTPEDLELVLAERLAVLRQSQSHARKTA